MKITHIWLKSARGIEEIYLALTGQSGYHDDEIRFEWVEGRDPESGLQLNLSREHGHIILRDEADACIRLDKDLFLGDVVLDRLVARIRAHEPGPIKVGQCIYIRGNEWEKKVAKEFAAQEKA